MNCIEKCSLAEKLDRDSAFLWKCLMGRRGHGWWLSKKSRDFCWENKKFFNTNTNNWTKWQLCTDLSKTFSEIDFLGFWIVIWRFEERSESSRNFVFYLFRAMESWEGLLVMFSVERRNFNGQFFRFLWAATKISSQISNTPQQTKVLFDKIEKPFQKSYSQSIENRYMQLKNYEKKVCQAF